MSSSKKGKSSKKGSAIAPPRPDGPGTFTAGASTHLLSTATREQVTQHTMRHSITTGTFEDVKFYLFSRRKRSGVVYAPRPLFANSALICKTSSHFDFVFSAGFAESEVTDMNASFPPNRRSHTLDYDYNADSDLEDDDDHELDVGLGYTQQPTPPEAPLNPPVVFTDGVDTSSVGTTVVVSGQEQSGQEVRGDVQDTPEDHVVQTSSREGASTSAQGRKGRVVIIEDIAYRTWEAFIYYAYFEQVSFAPLGSQKLPHLPPKTYEAPPCSPKSMYRLAEKYGIEKLKQLAADDLQTKMASHNIFVELFSSFAMTYTGVQDAELQYLRDHLAEEVVYRQIPTWLQALEDGWLPHGATAVFSRVLIGLASVRYGNW
ncbi:hypothetical protein TRAPUB_7706 [Trametes pubescens]|uniref:BTB domain-containing protein n=1 Tax=Trametes pubescens TaxID=154538 RepID=A0A1M2V2L1_TRAPU|nr:hypothetical protein TRAPUB_7706 [Trametes pubescens]